MFSELGKIFTLRPRHAEHADARFEIRRHERDEHRSNAEEKQEDIPFDMDDDMSVSVGALVVFLKDFLKTEQPLENTKTDKKPEKDDTASFTKENPEKHNPPASQTEAPVPVDPRREKAIQAYQSGQKSADGTSALPETDADGHPAGATGADILSNADVRIVHTLVNDLEKLLERGIGTLHLEPAASFLDSLVKATDNAKKVI